MGKSFSLATNLLIRAYGQFALEGFFKKQHREVSAAISLRPKEHFG